MSIKAVIFDAFGTLVDITDKRAPYRKALAHIGKGLSLDRSTLGARIMSSPVHLRELSQFLESTALVKPEMLQEWEADLAAEIASIQPFDDAYPTLQALRNMGIKTALCSNLALPYGPPLRREFQLDIDHYGMSYEIGAIKPNKRIYQHVLEVLDVKPHEALMAGDTVDADHTGPRQLGIHGYHLARKRPSPVEESVQSLIDILNIIER